jgi:hypothetical protein
MSQQDATQQVREMQAQVERARQDAMNTSRTITAVAGVVCALGSVGLAAAVALGRVPRESLGGVALLGFFAVMMLRAARAMRRPEHLAQEGVPAVAVFERVVGAGVRVHVSSASMEGTVSQTRARFTIEGTARGPYSVDVTDLIPSGAYGRLVKGTRMRAWVDRNRPELVLIDWNSQA